MASNKKSPGIVTVVKSKDAVNNRIVELKQFIIAQHTKIEGLATDIRAYIFSAIKERYLQIVALKEYVKLTRDSFYKKAEGRKSVKLDRNKYSEFLEKEIGYKLNTIENFFKWVRQFQINAEGEVQYNPKTIQALSVESIHQTAKSLALPPSQKKEYIELTYAAKSDVDPTFDSKKALAEVKSKREAKKLKKESEQVSQVKSQIEKFEVGENTVKTWVHKLDTTGIVEHNSLVVNELYGRFKNNKLTLDNTDKERIKVSISVLSSILIVNK